jgi:hypothetical protein
MKIPVINAIFLPSQGIFNFLVFIRPRYGSIRRAFPDNSRWWALCEAVLHSSSSGSARKERAAAVPAPQESDDQPASSGTKDVDDTSFPAEESDRFDETEIVSPSRNHGEPGRAVRSSVVLFLNPDMLPDEAPPSGDPRSSRIWQ